MNSTVDNANSTITDMAGFRLRRKAAAKRQEAIEAAEWLKLPNPGQFKARKTTALQELLRHAASVVYFAPVENYRGGTSVETLIKTCMIFKYDLRLVGDSVLQFSIVDHRFHAEVDVYFNEKIQDGSVAMQEMIAKLVLENRSRDGYVSPALLNIAMPS